MILGFANSDVVSFKK